MMSRSDLILTTSPRSQPAKNSDRTANRAFRQRLLYGRKRHSHTVKERDSETGLYYYGARYLDSKTSRWLSGDPAMGDYVPSAPVNDEARKRNGSLPGMGGVFNYVNLHVYHYAGNNPVKLVDPDGRDFDDLINAIEDTKILDTGKRIFELISAYRSEDSTQEELDAVTINIFGIFKNIKERPVAHTITGAITVMGFALYNENEKFHDLVDSLSTTDNIFISLVIGAIGNDITHTFRLGREGEYNARLSFRNKTLAFKNTLGFNISHELRITTDFGFEATIREPIRNTTFENGYFNIGLFYLRSF